MNKDIEEFVIDVTKNRHVGTNGFIAVCDINLNMVIDNEYRGKSVTSIGILPGDEMLNGKTSTMLYHAEIINSSNGYKESFLYVFKFVEGYCIIAAMPEVEATFMRDASIYTAGFMQIIIFSALLIFIYILVLAVRNTMWISTAASMMARTMSIMMETEISFTWKLTRAAIADFVSIRLITL